MLALCTVLDTVGAYATVQQTWQCVVVPFVPVVYWLIHWSAVVYTSKYHGGVVYI